MSKYVLLVLLAMSLLVACSPKGDWAGDPQKVHEVTADMSQDEVREILGEPTISQEVELVGVKMLVWEYNGPNDRVNIVFDGDKVMSTGLNGTEIVIPE